MDDRDEAGADALEVRHARPDDVPAILDLARRSLGWPGDHDDAELFHWKHSENPFGASPMWVALDGDRIVGFRTFLRWGLHAPDGALVRAVRAVDTATDPGYQGRGIFTQLTLGALDELDTQGVQLVFNTPNTKSLPGYLKMGWSKVGRLPVAVMLGRARSALLLATARQAASRSSIETVVGESAHDVLADQHAIARLLSAQATPARLATASSPEYLSWRYGHRPLRYRVMLQGSSPADGLAVFRLRHRGRAIEAAVCEVLTPGPDPSVVRSLLRRIARETDATYLLRLGGPLLSREPFVRVPRTGPILTCRRLDSEPVPALHDWGLVLGDVELL
jgi:GNAT superfamily N-acetyltransferase